jgi:hypothetical protein
MKSRIIGKKQLLSLSLVLAFGLSVFVNWYYTNQYKDIEEPNITKTHNFGDAQLVNSDKVIESTEDYLANAKLNRTKAHDNSIKHLEEIISDKNSDKDMVASAKEKLLNISDQIKAETDIENLIKAQLKCDCLVTYNVDSIEVVMPEKSVNDKTVTQIKDIILVKTSLSSDKILIIEFK